MHASPSEPREDAVIARNLPCVACAYNLCGLPRDGRCPECGTSISESLADWYERWTRALSPGCRIILAGGALAMLVAILLAQADWISSQRFATVLMVMFAASLGVMLITEVRWDTGASRWGDLPAAARMLTMLALLLAMSWYALPFAQRQHRMSVVMWHIVLSELATTFFYIYVARVTSRLGWRFISWQATLVVLLITLGMAIDLVRRQDEHRELWLIPGLGTANAIEFFASLICAGSFSIACTRLNNLLIFDGPVLPAVISVLAAALLMLQLAFAAAFRAKPPRVLAD